MVPFNWIAVVVASFVPLIIGAIWYNPKVFGTAWMNVAGLTEEKLKGANMMVIYLLCLIFSFFLSVGLSSIVIHQLGYYSIMAGEPGAQDPNSPLWQETNAFMAKYGDRFRIFKHGAFHGFLSSVLIVFPVLSINALFERRKWKYIWINWGFWAVSMMIMGSLICGWK
jgi:hypothetical protein